MILVITHMRQQQQERLIKLCDKNPGFIAGRRISSNKPLTLSLSLSPSSLDAQKRGEIFHKAPMMQTQHFPTRSLTRLRPWAFLRRMHFPVLL